MTHFVPPLSSIITVYRGERLTERVDAVSKRQQAAVDVSSFDHSLATVLRVGCSL